MTVAGFVVAELRTGGGCKSCGYSLWLELSSGKRKTLRVVKGSVTGENDKYSFILPPDSHGKVGVTSFFSGIEAVSTSILLKFPSVPGGIECEYDNYVSCTELAV